MRLDMLESLSDAQHMNYESRRRQERQPIRRRNPRYLADPRSPRLDSYNAPSTLGFPPFPPFPMDGDDDDDAGFSVFEPVTDAPYRADLDEPPLDDRLLRSTRFVPHRPASYPPNRPMSPDPIGLTDGADEDAGSLSARRRSATPLSGRRRSFSPSFSPSRVRTFEATEGDANLNAEGSQGRGVRDPTPPRSPSRAWLEEYNRNRLAASNDEQGGVLEPLLDRLRDRNRNLVNTLNGLRRTHSQYLRDSGNEDDMDESSRQIRRLRRRVLHRPEGEDGVAVGGPIAAGMGRSASVYGRSLGDVDEPEHDRRRQGVVFDPDFFPLGPLPIDEPALAVNDNHPDPESARLWSTLEARRTMRGEEGSIAPGGGALDDEENQGMLAMDQRGYITVVPRPTGDTAGAGSIYGSVRAFDIV